MEKEIIEQINKLTKELGEVVVNLEPKNPAEWDAMEKMQAAHKQLRGIDILTLVESPPRAPMTR